MMVDKNIFIQNVYYMLAYAFQELKQNNFKKIESEEFENIHQLLAEILIRGVSCQLKQGLHKEYIQIEEPLMTVKGWINISGTITERIQRRLEVICEHDEFSVDCRFNRIIKSTLTLLLRTDGLKPEQKTSLRRLLSYFDEVGIVDTSRIEWSALRFDRNTRSYQMLLYICNFIINGLLLTTESGRYKMREFSDERMCRLFEKFILEYYRKEHPRTDAKAKQIGWNINEEKSTIDILPILQTDVFLTLGERSLIIDAKYYEHTMQNHFDKNTIHSHNLNQIYVYVDNEDGKRKKRGTVNGMLLYAKTNEDFVPDGQIQMKNGNSIYFRTLDLNLEFSEIRKQLDEIISISKIN